MKVFTAKLKDIFSPGRYKSVAPTDIIFDAQLPFLKKILGEWVESVEKPNGDGKACFHYRFPPHVSIKDFREKLLCGDWGDFKVTDIRIHADGESDWPEARVYIKIK